MVAYYCICCHKVNPMPEFNVLNNPRNAKSVAMPNIINYGGFGIHDIVISYTVHTIKIRSMGNAFWAL